MKSWIVWLFFVYLDKFKSYEVKRDRKIIRAISTEM